MERFQLSKVVTVSSTDGPTPLPLRPAVHPRLPDCPSWAARLSTWQAPTVHRSVGQGGPTVHRVGRLLPTARASARLPACAAPTVAGVSRAAHASPTDTGQSMGSRGCRGGRPRLPTPAVGLQPAGPAAARLPPGVSSPDELDCPLTRRDCPPVSRKSAPDCPPGQLSFPERQTACVRNVPRTRSRPSRSERSRNVPSSSRVVG